MSYPVAVEAVSVVEVVPALTSAFLSSFALFIEWWRWRPLSWTFLSNFTARIYVPFVAFTHGHLLRCWYWSGFFFICHSAPQVQQTRRRSISLAAFFQFSTDQQMAFVNLDGIYLRLIKLLRALWSLNKLSSRKRHANSQIIRQAQVNCV